MQNTNTTRTPAFGVLRFPLHRPLDLRDNSPRYGVAAPYSIAAPSESRAVVCNGQSTLVTSTAAGQSIKQAWWKGASAIMHQAAHNHTRSCSLAPIVGRYTCFSPSNSLRDASWLAWQMANFPEGAPLPCTLVGFFPVAVLTPWSRRHDPRALFRFD